MNAQDLKIFQTLDELYRASAEMVLECAREAIEEKGTFNLALSGGSTPNGLYDLMASAPFKDEFPWKQTVFFQGDERCVPPDNALSNHHSAEQRLFSKVTVPTENIHRIEAELTPLELASEKYEKLLKEYFKDNGSFDLLMLGMGEDGHTASLFPNSPQLEENSKWVLPVLAPRHIKPHVPRITLTYPILNRARNILFMVKGQKKLDLIQSFQAGDKQKYPASNIKAEKTLRCYGIS
jgi:6-phosphogluconolactonase